MTSEIMSRDCIDIHESSANGSSPRAAKPLACDDELFTCKGPNHFTAASHKVAFTVKLYGAPRAPAPVAERLNGVVVSKLRPMQKG